MPTWPWWPPSVKRATPTRLHHARFVRNGLIPHAQYESDLTNALNFVGACCNKELFRNGCALTDIPDSSGTTRVRWRFAGHTGPLLRQLRATLYMARKNAGDPIFSPKVTVYITNADESTTYGSATFQFGAAPLGGANDWPSEFGQGMVIIEGVPASTTIYGRIEETDEARLISASVYEQSKPISAANGYVVPDVVSAQQPILDERRQAMLELASSLWHEGAAPLYSWSADIQSSPKTTTSTSPVNILDGAAVVDETSPAPTLDTSYGGTAARPNAVPCTFAVRAKVTGGSGRVYLEDVLGGTLAAISFTETTETWKSTTLDLEALTGKYHVTFEADSGETISAYAASLFQLA